MPSHDSQFMNKLFSKNTFVRLPEYIFQWKYNNRLAHNLLAYVGKHDKTYQVLDSIEKNKVSCSTLGEEKRLTESRKFSFNSSSTVTLFPKQSPSDYAKNKQKNNPAPKRPILMPISQPSLSSMLLFLSGC